MTSQGQLPSLPKRPGNPLLWAAGVLLLAFLASAWHVGVPGTFTGENVGKMSEYFSRFAKPEWGILRSGLALMGQTIATGFWGTALAVVLGFLAAPIATSGLGPGWAYRGVRGLMNFFRAMPDVLLTLVFLNALELGPWPAVLALGLHTGAALAKFFSENMERVDKGIYEAMRASGAGFLQMAQFAAWPSTLREAISYTLYIFDRNVRMATILGVVGAGGIGRELKSSLDFFNYPYAATLILIVMLAVLLIDTLSNTLRQRLA